MLIAQIGIIILCLLFTDTSLQRILYLYVATYTRDKLHTILQDKFSHIVQVKYKLPIITREKSDRQVGKRRMFLLIKIMQCLRGR